MEKVCENCKYADLSVFRYPCSECKYGDDDNVKDKFKSKETNDVEHPDHYNHGIECFDEIEEIFGKEELKIFCKLNIWKYRKRALYKNGEEDMKKADEYMKKFIELGE